MNNYAKYQHHVYIKIIFLEKLQICIFPGLKCPFSFSLNKNYNKSCLPYSLKHNLYIKKIKFTYLTETKHEKSCFSFSLKQNYNTSSFPSHWVKMLLNPVFFLTEAKILINHVFLLTESKMLLNPVFFLAEAKLLINHVSLLTESKCY